MHYYVLSQLKDKAFYTKRDKLQAPGHSDLLPHTAIFELTSLCLGTLNCGVFVWMLSRAYAM